MAQGAQGVSADYIKEHMHNVHTPESWARSLVELAMNAASSKLGTGSAQSVEVDAKFTISAYEPLGCIRVCAVINGITVCYHINT